MKHWSAEPREYVGYPPLASRQPELFDPRTLAFRPEVLASHILYYCEPIQWIDRADETRRWIARAEERKRLDFVLCG